MGLLTQKIDEIALNATRLNPSYSCGLLVDPKKVIGSLLENPWVKATTSLNGYEMKKWAEDADMGKIGTAVVIRNPEGTDIKTIMNPKISSGVYSDNAGKTSVGSTHGNNATEMEVVFAAGKNIAPTVVAQRSTYFPGTATVQANQDTAVPPMLDANGNPIGEGALRQTANGTNAATGTILKPASSLTFLDKAGLAARGLLNPLPKQSAFPASVSGNITGKTNAPSKTVDNGYKALDPTQGGFGVQKAAPPKTK